MRKLLIAAAAAGAITLGGLGAAAPALASTGGNGTAGSPGNSTIVKATGKNAFAYYDWFFGPVSCAEVHHSGAQSGQSFDSIACTSTTGLPLTNVVPGESGSFQGNWLSDFGTGQFGTLNWTVSSDGMSYTGTGVYS